MAETSEERAAPERAAVGVSVDVAVDVGGRLDKALAAAAPAFSRSRLAALIAEGAVRRADGAEVTDPAVKVKPGERFFIAPPPPRAAAPAPEAIALDVLHEDAALIVVNKPAGMAAHPAPGSETGTLVNALLHHCGAGLSGIGGVARPGIVHRLDKDTSGLLVAAKTDAAHAVLSAQFAAHNVERRYLALLWGAPDRADPRLAGHPAARFGPDGALIVDAPIARRPTDRKRMGVLPRGKRAVTHVTVLERYGPAERPVACRVACRLETGRTHQIRVHLAHIGFPLIGDPAYGRPRPAPACARDFPRQALHAETLGFAHPDDGRSMRFSREPPEDFALLVNNLGVL